MTNDKQPWCSASWVWMGRGNEGRKRREWNGGREGERERDRERETERERKRERKNHPRTHRFVRLDENVANNSEQDGECLEQAVELEPDRAQHALGNAGIDHGGRAQEYPREDHHGAVRPLARGGEEHLDGANRTCVWPRGSGTVKEVNSKRGRDQLQRVNSKLLNTTLNV